MQLWPGAGVKPGQVVFSRGGHVRACFSTNLPAVTLISTSQRSIDLSAIRDSLILIFPHSNSSVTQAELSHTAADQWINRENTKASPAFQNDSFKWAGAWKLFFLPFVMMRNNSGNKCFLNGCSIPLVVSINLFNSCQRRHLTVSFTHLLLCALRCGEAELLLRDLPSSPFAVQTLIESNQNWAVISPPLHTLSLGSPLWINPGLCRGLEPWPLTLCDRIKAETFVPVKLYPARSRITEACETDTSSCRAGGAHIQPCRVHSVGAWWTGEGVGGHLVSFHLWGLPHWQLRGMVRECRCVWKGLWTLVLTLTNTWITSCLWIHLSTNTNKKYKNQNTHKTQTAWVSSSLQAERPSPCRAAVK